jgi:hypothetical protein
MATKLEHFRGNSTRFSNGERVPVKHNGADATIVGVTDEVTAGFLNLVMTKNGVDFVVARGEIKVTNPEAKQIHRAIEATRSRGILRLPMQPQLAT